MGLNTDVMFSKESDEWYTPDDYYLKLHRRFNFNVDLAANRTNRKCEFYLGLDHEDERYRNSLGVVWHTLPVVQETPLVGFEFIVGEYPHVRVRGWLNPPYSLCDEFVEKSAYERRYGVLSVLLIPARTDTQYFHDHIYNKQTGEWREGVGGRFIKGRLKFGGAKTGAPFPSLVVWFIP